MAIQPGSGEYLGSEAVAEPLVSVIIPSYHSARTLEAVLDSLRSQTYPRVEALVVDRPSGDGTEGIVRDKGFTYIPLEAERTIAFAHGVARSRGEYLYYIGSDYVLDPRTIEAAVEACEREKADAAMIPNYIDAQGSFWSKVRALEKETYAEDDLIEAARFFSRQAYLAAGGYDPRMVAYEEHDLHNRLLGKGFKIIRIKGVRETNIGEPGSLGGYARKYFYYGQTIGLYLESYPRKARVQLSPIRPSFLRHYRKFLSHPGLTAGFVLYQLTRYTAAGLGYSTALLGGKNHPKRG